MDIRKMLGKIKAVLGTRRGHNAVVFSCFLVLSAVLWVVQSISEETQKDFRFRISFFNVPDSLTRITPLPDFINVSVRARGTQLIKYSLTESPEIRIDYRKYRSGNSVSLPQSELKTYFRDVIGSGCQVQSVNPDSLMVLFTSKPGVMMTVRPVINEDSYLQTGIVKNAVVLNDTVKLYTLDGKVGKTRYINTEPINVNDVHESQTLRVALVTPPRSRVIPDSVEVMLDIEPVVSRKVKVDIRAVNVPKGMKLITVPTQAEIYYMAPADAYNVVPPPFKVTVDYATIDPYNDRVAVRLSGIPKDLQNVFIDMDSVQYLIEQ